MQSIIAQRQENVRVHALIGHELGQVGYDRFDQLLQRLVPIRNRSGKLWTLPLIAGDALCEVIRGPAELAGLDVSEVQEAMVAEARDEPGALPLVQNALQWLWEHRAPDGRLSGRLFNERGGLAGILSEGADGLLASLGKQRGQALELLFRLVSVDPDPWAPGSARARTLRDFKWPRRAFPDELGPSPPGDSGGDPRKEGRSGRGPPCLPAGGLPSIQHLLVTPPVPVQGRGAAAVLLPPSNDHVAVPRIGLDYQALCRPTICLALLELEDREAAGGRQAGPARLRTTCLRTKRRSMSALSSGRQSVTGPQLPRDHADALQRRRSKSPLSIFWRRHVC